MADSRQVVVCRQCREGWELHEPPACRDPCHQHLQLAWHRHRSEVVLPGGTTVVAVSFDAADPYERDVRPDYGLYLDGRWQPPWPHNHVHWPDFGGPEDPAALMSALHALRQRATAGERVEIGCYGGHGRTGTALALMAVLDGHARRDAVAWVRAHYCAEAVETAEQEAFVAEAT